MGITLAENQVDLTGNRLFVEDRRIKTGRIAWGPRIGINIGTEHDGECTSWVSRPFQAGVWLTRPIRHAQPLTDVGFAKCSIWL
jgi:hypothetical protein